MSFFRKWKLSSKHKKLSEDWGLATSLKDVSEMTDVEEDSNPNASFALKYLGNTSIGTEKSKNATAEAIKTVMASSKSTRRKGQRVNLNVSTRGIEVLDAATGSPMIRVSIYKISYCSADAAHDHVFAFIGSPEYVAINDLPEAGAAEKQVGTPEMATGKDKDTLTCFVFLCAKRRIAHDVTLTVARCFENAYQMWRHTVEKKMCTEEIQNRSNKDKSLGNGKENSDNNNREESIGDLLIDFTPDMPAKLLENDHRQYLQNTWVAFDDESKDVDRFRNALWEQQLVC